MAQDSFALIVPLQLFFSDLQLSGSHFLNPNGVFEAVPRVTSSKNTSQYTSVGESLFQA